MEKDLIFFGEGGITDTVANRVADFAKLSYTSADTELLSISFLNQKIETIDGQNQKDIAYGTTDVSGIEDKIVHIGELKALCAWLREAVSAHQRLIREAENYSFDEYVRSNGIEMPTEPTLERTITEDDVLSLFDVKKRNRYYYLEALSATIGQAIHKNGSIDSARKALYEKISHPRYTTGSGLDTIIYTYEPSISTEKVEDMFYSLQQKHAEYQSELNSIKSEIKSRITNDEIEKTNKFESELSAYNATRREVYAKYSAWKAEEQKRIYALKIIIPNALKGIYDKVSSTGKK